MTDTIEFENEYGETIRIGFGINADEVDELDQKLIIKGGIKYRSQESKDMNENKETAEYNYDYFNIEAPVYDMKQIIDWLYYFNVYSPCPEKACSTKITKGPELNGFGFGMYLSKGTDETKSSEIACTYIVMDIRFSKSYYKNYLTFYIKDNATTQNFALIFIEALREYYESQMRILNTYKSHALWRIEKLNKIIHNKDYHYSCKIV